MAGVCDSSCKARPCKALHNERLQACFDVISEMVEVLGMVSFQVAFFGYQYIMLIMVRGREKCVK
jgi:hypothetical protein